MTHEFTVGGVSIPVTVEPNPNICTTGCTYDGNPAYKCGYYFSDSDEIIWTVGPPAGPQGMAVGQDVTIEDPFDLTQFEILDGFPRLDEAGAVYTDEFGRDAQSWASRSDEVTVSDSGRRVKFTTRPGAWAGRGWS